MYYVTHEIFNPNKGGTQTKSSCTYSELHEGVVGDNGLQTKGGVAEVLFGGEAARQ